MAAQVIELYTDTLNTVGLETTDLFMLDLGIFVCFLGLNLQAIQAVLDI